MDPVEKIEEDESENERERDKHDRYLRSSMDEVSDDELWRHLHHGRPGEDDGSPRAHRTDTDAQLQSMMRDTNDILRAKILSWQHALEAAAVLNEVPVPATDAMELQIFKAPKLMYSI